MNSCLLCSLPLTESEIALNQRWHPDCQRCSICKAEMPSVEMTEKAIADQKPLAHTECEDRQLEADFKNKDLPLTQLHLNKLNSFILSRRPENILSLDALYPLLRDLQQAAANVSIAISRQRDKTKIREAENYRAHVEIESENIKQAKRINEENKIRRASERADPRLRDRRKAIEGLIDIGMSREQAEGMVPQVKPQ